MRPSFAEARLPADANEDPCRLGRLSQVARDVDLDVAVSIHRVSFFGVSDSRSPTIGGLYYNKNPTFLVSL